MIRLFGNASALLHGQHRAGRKPHDLFGRAAEQDMLHAGASVGPDHDQVGREITGGPKDLPVGDAGCERGLLV